MRDMLQPPESGERKTKAGDAGAFESEQIFSVGPAAILFTHEILDRHANIGEEHLVHLMLAVEQHDRPDFYARRFHVNETEGNALLLLDRAVGANQTDDRSEDRAVGKRGASTCRYSWSPYH